MEGRYEIRIAGSGGQGVIVATELIGMAAALYEKDLFVVQSQAYGPEARGGKSKAEVVLSKEAIDYPKVIAPRLQVILTQPAADEFAPDTMPGGRIVYDDFFVTSIPGFSEEGGVEHSENVIDAHTYVLPIVRTARDKIGREIVTNMVALGAAGRVLELDKVMSPDSLRKAIVNHFTDKKIADLNIQAFNEGYALFKESVWL
ncbi:MAG: 2-oxoacid:acceptor oxidoreductase family protein [Synergistaceae bacterium]|nr:2-oxoacid:acceptor oxidoreductase family protein [Synergistaceae bacterium]